MQKLYCYVDESGQDTKGKYFVVAVVIVDSIKLEVEEILINLENESKRGKHKWNASRYDNKLNYVRALSKVYCLKEKIFTQVFSEGKSYLEKTANVVANSIEKYIQMNNIIQFKSVIIVDGLKGSEGVKFVKIIRNRGISTEKIRGVRDESNSIIRLADSMAGLVRNSHKGNIQMTQIKNQLKKKNILIEL